MFGKRPRRRVSGQVRETRIRQIKIIGGLSTLFILIVLGFLVWLSHFDRMRIDEVLVSGERVVRAGEVEEIVREALVGKYLWLFARENIATYPKDDIVNALYETYPRIKEIAIERDGFNTLVVGITEYEPNSLWCGNGFIGERDPTEQCYFADEKGYIFALAPDFSGSAYFKYYGILDEDVNPVRQSLFTDSERMRVEDLLGLFETVGFESSTLSWTTDGDYIIYLEKGGEIRVAQHDDFKHVFENLQSLIDVDPFKSDYIKKADQLEYVDLRFGNKVLYRFRESD